MFVMNEEDALQHYGIIGMKWGKRKGNLSSRIKGAALDRNQRGAKMIKRAIAGPASQTFEERMISAPDRWVAAKLGSDYYNKMLKNRLVNLTAQTARIEAGKKTVDDKLMDLMSISVLDLVVSRQDNKG